jgi:hypothetical protein
VCVPRSPGMSHTGATWVGRLSRWALRGPDRGLITFQADGDQQAKRVVDTDPFVQEGLLKAHWLKQWIPQ